MGVTIPLADWRETSSVLAHTGGAALSFSPHLVGALELCSIVVYYGGGIFVLHPSL